MSLPLSLSTCLPLLTALEHVDDTHADTTLVVLFLLTLIGALLFYHTPRRVARLADYFSALNLEIVPRGRFGWWLDGPYRGVHLRVECGSTVRGSGPFALVATIQYSVPLQVNPAALLPKHATVYAAEPGRLQFRLPEELYESASELEPIGLINRLVQLDPAVNTEPPAAPPTHDLYHTGPLHLLNLAVSLLGAAGAMYCAWAVSFFAAAGVLSAAILAAVLISSRRRAPSPTGLATRAAAVQLALALALCILGCGLCYTRYGTLALKDFEPRPVGNVVEIPHEQVRLTVTRQLERGDGQIGPGGKIYANSLIWSITDHDGFELENGRMTLPLSEFEWIAPNWDPGQKMFVLGILHEYDAYTALALMPLFPDGQSAPATPAPGDPRTADATGRTVFRYWVRSKPAVPPGTPLYEILRERIRRDEKSRLPANPAIPAP